MNNRTNDHAAGEVGLHDLLAELDFSNYEIWAYLRMIERRDHETRWY